MAALKAAVPPFLAGGSERHSPDLRVLITLTLVLSVLTGDHFGLASRRSSPRAAILQGIIKDSAQNLLRARHPEPCAASWSSSDMAFVLLTGSGLLIRSFFPDATGRYRASVFTHQCHHCRPAQSQRALSRSRQLNEACLAVAFLTNLGALPGVPAMSRSRLLCRWRDRATECRFGWRAAQHWIKSEAGSVFLQVLFSPSSSTHLEISAAGTRFERSRRRPERQPLVTVVDGRWAKMLPNQNPIGKRILIQQIVPGGNELVECLGSSRRNRRRAGHESGRGSGYNPGVYGPPTIKARSILAASSCRHA